MKFLRSTLLAVVAFVGSHSGSRAQTNVLNSTGNVGIGTTSPASPLHVRGEFTPGWMQLGIQASGSDDRAGLTLWNGASERLGVIYWGPEGFLFGNDKAGPFRFFTGGAERLWIGADGNVGIGTSSPGAKLAVNGVIRAYNSNQGYGEINLESSEGGTYTGLQLRKENTSVWGIKSVSAANDIALYTDNLMSNGVYMKSGGNVGIGTMSPSSKLEVAGQITVKEGTGLYSSTTSSGINFGGGSAYNTGAKITVWGRDSVYNANCIQFTNGDNVDRMFVSASGNVGIGTTAPTQKLSVNGTIRAKEVVVETTGWSDYVFADGYDLKPLAEVERHIKQNKHLPGIPSAEEVAEKGVGVGEMQSKLLAKIEELVLHQIEQEKELKAQAQTIKQLQVALSVATGGAGSSVHP